MLVAPDDRAATESLTRPATGFVNRYRHRTAAGICDVRHAGSPEALLPLADEALHRSKAGGTARTVVHGEDG